MLVEDSLVSSTYERSNGKGKKAATAKITLWTIRADVVRIMFLTALCCRVEVVVAQFTV